MTRSFLPLGLFTLALLLAAGAAATAAPVSWSYSWSASADGFAADPGGSDSIALRTTPAGTLSGPASLNALSFTTLTPDLLSEHFSGRGYNLTLDVTDNDVHKSGSLTFAGTLGGTLAPASDGITVGFDNLSGSLALGSHRFDVTLSPPPAPGLGVVSAQVSIDAGVSSGPPPGPKPKPPEPGPGPSPSPGPSPGPSPEPRPHDSPEPSTLVLAGLGLSALGGGAWWRRRQARLAQPG
jgi:hypothetical protein